jgi:hypothetical protein
LRYLLRAAEEAISKPPTVPGLQAQVTLAKNEVQAIKSQLADTVRKQDLDHASAAEEKDGRKNEGYVQLFYKHQYIITLPRKCNIFLEGVSILLFAQYVSISVYVKLS